MSFLERFSQARANLAQERKEEREMKERLRLEELAAQEKEIAEQNERTAQHKRNRETLRSVMMFPGSKEKFEEFIGYRCVVLDTRMNDKGLVMRPKNLDRFRDYDANYQQYLVDSGLVALVDAVPISAHIRGDDDGRYGLPVRKARDRRQRG